MRGAQWTLGRYQRAPGMLMWTGRGLTHTNDALEASDFLRVLSRRWSDEEQRELGEVGRRTADEQRRVGQVPFGF